MASWGSPWNYLPCCCFDTLENLPRYCLSTSTSLLCYCSRLWTFHLGFLQSSLLKCSLASWLSFCICFRKWCFCLVEIVQVKYQALNFFFFFLIQIPANTSNFCSLSLRVLENRKEWILFVMILANQIKTSNDHRNNTETDKEMEEFQTSFPGKSLLRPSPGSHLNWLNSHFYLMT